MRYFLLALLCTLCLGWLAGCASAPQSNTGVSEADSAMEGKWVCQAGYIIGMVLRVNGPGEWTIPLDPKACGATKGI